MVTYSYKINNFPIDTLDQYDYEHIYTGTGGIQQLQIAGKDTRDRCSHSKLLDIPKSNVYIQAMPIEGFSILVFNKGDMVVKFKLEYLNTI